MLVGVCKLWDARVRRQHTGQNTEAETKIPGMSSLRRDGDRCPLAAVALTD